MLPTIHESRKVTGLVIVLAALLVLVILAIVAMWLTGVGWELFGAIGTQITTLGAAHQAAQGAQDRAQAYSPNYPSLPLAPAPPTAPPLGGSPPPGAHV